jgi:hypothetical protein
MAPLGENGKDFCPCNEKCRQGDEEPMEGQNLQKATVSIDPLSPFLLINATSWKE